MPKAYSRKRIRDDAAIARWRAAGEGAVAGLGLKLEAVEAAQRALLGEILLPGDPGYDDRRMLFNPAFNPTPMMIVACASEADVRVALALSALSPMPLTLRSGGHSTAGYSGGTGVLVDLGQLDHVVVDPVARTAVVGAGCPFGKLNQALAAAGLHVPTGDCDDVCVGGFVQGGGLSRSSVTFGMNCDNVLSLRVMLADGSVVVADPTCNADLFWAVRGGTGGNFGVLLEVTYGCVPLGDVTGFSIAWDASTPAGIARCVQALLLLQQRYMAGSPFAPALNLQALLVWQTLIDPNGPTRPTPVPVFMVRGLWVGDPSGAEAAMAPLRALPGAVQQFVLTAPFLKVVDALLNSPQDQPIIDPARGMPNEDKASRYVQTALGAEDWTGLLTYLTGASPNTLSYMYLEFYGGRIASYPADGNAFVHRTAWYNAVLDVFWYEPHERKAAEAFLQGWIDRIRPWWSGEVYQNYCSVNVGDYRAAYWGAAIGGLARVKAKYDPGRRFTFAQEATMYPGQPPAPLGSLPPALAAALAQPIDYAGGRPPGIADGP